MSGHCLPPVVVSIPGQRLRRWPGLRQLRAVASQRSVACVQWAVQAVSKHWPTQFGETRRGIVTVKQQEMASEFDLRFTDPADKNRGFRVLEKQDRGSTWKLTQPTGRWFVESGLMSATLLFPRRERVGSQQLNAAYTIINKRSFYTLVCGVLKGFHTTCSVRN